MTTTTTIHAWFSAAEALSFGSSVYRKPSGFVVNVTRVSDRRESKSSHRHDEQYVGRVVRKEDGGQVEPRRRVPGITTGS
jgi:hypothetical protein